MQETIMQVENCRDLGITLQDNATFSLQVEKVCKKVRQKSGWILRTFYSRNQKFLRHMWNTLVQPHVDYCSQLWAPGGGADLEKLEGLLRTFTSKIPAVKHMSYWERLKVLKMNSEQRGIERYRVIYTWKVLEELVPNCGLESKNESERLGRTCSVPKLKGSTKTKNLRDNSFQSLGPKIFNSLPKELRNITKVGVDDFKLELDKYLTHMPDEPKVSGMTPSCLNSTSEPSNSIVHWSAKLRRDASWRTPGI